MSNVKEKIPIAEGSGREGYVPKTSSKINAISVDGVSYCLSTDLDEEFMNDFHNLPGEEIVKKYNLREADVVGAEREGQASQGKQSS
jgi:hypothetical protein